MDNQNPGVVEPIPPPIPYKDRSAGLIVFGILTILLGCLVGLLSFLMLIGLMASSTQTTPAPVPLSTILPVMSIYVVLAVALIWLGIGSIQARRWARALLLIFSWSWLVMGIFMTVFIAFMMPKILANQSSSGTSDRPAAPAGSIAVAMVVTVLFFGIFFVVVPALWTFFYNSRNVKATCESCDSVPRWTDACPLPVLGFSLWLAFAVPMMLIMPFTGHCVMPCFGMFLTGVPGASFCLAMAALWGYAAWCLYKLEQRGWWLILIAICGFTVSALMTYARHDVVEMYQLMGYPQAQIDQIQKSGLMAGNRMMWLTSLVMVPFLGYLLFIRKYLFRKS